MIQYNTNSFTSLLLIISGPWMRCRVIYTDLDREKAEHSTPLLSYLFHTIQQHKVYPCPDDSAGTRPKSKSSLLHVPRTFFTGLLVKGRKDSNGGKGLNSLSNALSFPPLTQFAPTIPPRTKRSSTKTIIQRLVS